MTAPKISIVTPSYNQGEFLEETIQSVLDQGYPNLEYLILDGGSTDGSVEIIKKYEDHLTYWRSHADSGQAAALREGFEIVSGEILHWLNSDDLLASGALTKVGKVYQEHGPNVVIAGGCRVFGGERGIVEHWPRFQRAFEAPETMPLIRMLDIMVHWFPGEFFYQPEVFFPRSEYRRAGGINPTIHYAMDYDLWIRLALTGAKIVVIDQILAQYREHGGQKTADFAGLHQEMVQTANRYLRHDGIGLQWGRRRMLAAANALSLHYPTRKIVSYVRRRVGL